jgi:hypothetical protein
MAEGIPDHLSAAFRQAVAACRDWSGDDRQPPVIGMAWDQTQIPEPQHPEILCTVIGYFTDEMPTELISLMASLPYNVGDSVGRDRSYANGARCLLQFIKLKRKMYDGNR